MSREHGRRVWRLGLPDLLVRGLFPLAICGASDLARADEGALREPGSEPSSEEPAAASPPAPELNRLAAEQATTLVRKAAELFHAGQAANAIPLLEEAYEISGWQGCLLNLAMAHHSLGQCEVARDHYQRYLDGEPYTERLAEVISALAELHERCGVGSPPAPASLERPPPATEPDIPQFLHPKPPKESNTAPLLGAPKVARYEPAALPPPAGNDEALQIAKWSLLGAGAMTAIAATVFALAAQRKNAEADHFGRFSAGDPRAQDIHSTGVLYNRLTLGFGIGTGLLWGAGGALWLIERDESAEGISAQDNVLVRYRGRF